MSAPSNTPVSKTATVPASTPAQRPGGLPSMLPDKARVWDGRTKASAEAVPEMLLEWELLEWLVRGNVIHELRAARVPGGRVIERREHSFQKYGPAEVTVYGIAFAPDADVGKKGKE